MTVKEYRDVKALSQSSLKLLDWSPRDFYEKEYLWLTGQKEREEDKPTAAMEFGSLVDCKLLTPKEFDSLYAILDCELPPPQMLKFTDLFYKKEKYLTNNYTREITPEERTDILKESYDETGFKRDSLDSVIARVEKESLGYYKFLRKSDGKKVVSKEDNLDADRHVMSIMSDEFTSQIFQPEKDVELLPQLPLFMNYKGVELKGLIDLASVDHKKKHIMLYDLKTCGESNFATAFQTRRYDIQGALYGKLAEETFKDYLVLAFNFLVVYTGNYGPSHPELFVMDITATERGTDGGINMYQKKVPGYNQILDNYLWHVTNKKWKYSRETYEGNGFKVLE